MYVQTLLVRTCHAFFSSILRFNEIIYYRITLKKLKGKEKKKTNKKQKNLLLSISETVFLARVKEIERMDGSARERERE